MRSVGDASRLDERLHLAPRRHTAPWPETLIESGSTFLLDLTDSVDHIQGIEQLWRDGHLPVNASLALFQALNDDDPVGQVNAFGSQGQRLGYPATGIAQDAAEGPYLPRRLGRSGQKPFRNEPQSADVLHQALADAVSRWLLVRSQTPDIDALKFLC